MAAAQPPPAETQSVTPRAWPQPILQVDVHASTLREQPNMHGIGVMSGPDGHPRVLCVEPSELVQPARLRLDMQSGGDAVRYK